MLVYWDQMRVSQNVAYGMIIICKWKEFWDYEIPYYGFSISMSNKEIYRPSKSEKPKNFLLLMLTWRNLQLMQVLMDYTE